MAVTVGSLIIDLSANTASFTSEMGKASNLAAKSANDIKRSLEKITIAGAAMATALVTGTAGVIRSALDQVDALGKAAQAAGTTAETLSTLQYAAKLSNVENEQLVKGLEKLSLAAFKAQGGNVQLENIFKRLGVSVMDANGHLKDSGVLLEQMAPKFAAMGDGAGKTALAQAIFGKAGASLIPMLNMYGEEQARVNDEAHRFGLVLSQSTVDVAMKAHDNLDRLSTVMKGMGFSLLSATLPALDQLLQKLLNISATSNLQDLAKAFGDKVVGAVHLLGDALDFAVKNAHALKIALEAIAAVKIASIAIPIVADLAGGGIANVGKGIDKATLGMLGFERAATALPKIGSAISGVAGGFYGAAKGASVAEVAALGLEEGFGSLGKTITSLSFASMFASLTGGVGRAVTALKSLTAASVLTSLTGALRAIPALFATIATGAANAGKAMMLAALSNPWTAAALAIAGVVALLYTFRDATFSLGGSTYELRDTWNAAWILMKDTVGGVVDWFKKQMEEIKAAWSGVVKWFRENPIGNFISTDLSDANTRLDGYVSRFANAILGGGKIQAALNEAKRQREAANKPTPDAALPSVSKPAKPLADTSGLGKPKKDIFGDEIRKLDEAIAAQRAYLSVLDGTPDVIQAATAAEKAHAVIVELNNKLTDEGRAKLTAKQQAMIVDRVTTEEAVKALVDYGRELVGQQHSTELSIQQARAMAAANLEGDDAVRRATISNALLALSFNKTTAEMAEFLKRKPELEALLTQKSNTELLDSTNREIFAIRQETAAQAILHSAIMGTLEAQDQASVASKTYALNQQIAATADMAARFALIDKRDALIAQTEAQRQANDLEEARKTLGGPGDEFALQKEHLGNLVDALMQAQDGYLTYAQKIQIAAAQQEIFDKAIDQTVQSMIRFGDARDGVNAFFLDMQKSAQSTASIIYDSLHSAFDKISENLTQLVTGGKTNFAKMFEDIGKQMLNAEIKQQLQKGIGALGGKLGINLGGLLGKEQKIDGSSANNALWVRMASADGSELTSFGQPRTTNELTGLIGPNPQSQATQAVQQVNQIAQHPPTSVSGALSDLPSFIKLLGGMSSQKSPFGESLGMPKGNELTDLLGPGGDQTSSGDSGGGILSVLGGMSQGTPKGTASSPFYVKTTGGSGLPGGSGGTGGLGSLFGGSSGGGFTGDESAMNFATDEGIGGGGLFSGLLSKLGGLFGGSGGGLGSILSMVTGLIPHAEGGPVTPSSAYLVGEKGPEVLTGASGQITSNANSMRALSSSTGPTVHYAIDARGTDPAQTEQRVRRAILESHQSAITTSIQGNAERLKRVPQRY